MKLLAELGIFLTLILFLTGCHTFVLIDEEDYEDEEEAFVVEETVVEPSIPARIFFELMPLIFREIVIEASGHHHMPPVIHGQNGSNGTPDRTDNQRSTQTGRGSENTGNQTENKSSSGQSTRDSGSRRSGK
ncbi:MAG: hypothetical protein JXA06_09825 [Bacteroidetes bacterium]|nr:hypothetical protein [Bacteroidota bacterium]